MAALDKALDGDQCLNHDFLQQAENLISQKQEHPGLRLTKTMKESVQVVEEKRQGIRKPKRKFLTLEAYERKYGAPDAAKIKTQRIDGQEIKGIDVVDLADAGVYEYLDETVNSVQRQTNLSDPDLVISTDQTSSIFASAVKHIAPAAKDDSMCVMVEEKPSGSDGREASAAAPASTETAPGLPNGEAG